jgi:hypothetical protein
LSVRDVFDLSRVFLIERQDPVIEDIDGCDRNLGEVQRGEAE